MKKQQSATSGLTKLGRKTTYRFDNPDIRMLEAFHNQHPERDYIISFEHPEFTSVCPITGQPDFATITLRYVPDVLCVESKSFKLYISAFRNHGAFMEVVTNKIADDLINLLMPRRLTIDSAFNIRGGTAISVRVNYLKDDLKKDQKKALKELW